MLPSRAYFCDLLPYHDDGKTANNVANDPISYLFDSSVNSVLLTFYSENFEFIYVTKTDNKRQANKSCTAPGQAITMINSLVLAY